MKTIAYTSTNPQRNAENVAFASLFGSSDCKSTFLGKGDTYFGINQIKEWILQNQNEIDTNKAIAYFKSSSLLGLVDKIHQTLHKNFNYNADGYKQELLAPNCAFTRRLQGLDCKSFTVLASIFLLKNNVVHYLRKIKQDNSRPNEFSHIFVIVPKDQKTGSLKQGYYVLDGTLPINVEPFYTAKHDIKMSKLPYYGLKGASNAQTTTLQPQTTTKAYESKKRTLFLKSLQAKGVISATEYITATRKLKHYLTTGVIPTIAEILPPKVIYGLNGDSTETNGDSLSDIATDALENFDFSSLFEDFSFDNFINQLSCIGGSAYDSDWLKSDISKYQVLVKKAVEEINRAALKNDMVLLETAVQNYYGFAAMTNHVFTMKRNEGWNSCSTKNFNVIIDLSSRVRYIGGKALSLWFNNYYNVKKLNTRRYFSENVVNHLFAGYVGNGQGKTQYAWDYQVSRKDENEEVKAFVFNDYLANAPSSNQVNTNDFLNSLTTVLIPKSSTSNPATTPNSNNLPTANHSSVKQASLGNWLFGSVLIGTAVYYGAQEIKKMQNKKSKK